MMMGTSHDDDNDSELTAIHHSVIHHSVDQYGEPLPEYSQVQSKLARLELNKNTFSTSEQVAIYAMLSTSPTQQAIGFQHCRQAFPNAEQTRLNAKKTGHIENSLDRYNALFPPDRYGKHRTLKTFEDKTTYFHDLDPNVDIIDGDEGPNLGPENHVPDNSNSNSNSNSNINSNSNNINNSNSNNTNKELQSGGNIQMALIRQGTSPAFSPYPSRSPSPLNRRSSLDQIYSEARANSPDHLHNSPDLDFCKETGAFTNEERERTYMDSMEECGNEARIDLFSQRVSSAMTDDHKIGRQRYLDACGQFNIQPNTSFLDNIRRTHLDLSFYGLSGPQVKAMSTSFRINKYIVCVNLSDNKIGDEFGSSFINAMGENFTTTYLNMAGNNLSTRSGLELASCLNVNGESHSVSACLDEDEKYIRATTKTPLNSFSHLLRSAQARSQSSTSPETTSMIASQRRWATFWAAKIGEFQI